MAEPDHSVGSPSATRGHARPIRLAFVVNVDWFFLSHRLGLATAARDAGWRVTVIAADTGSAERIRHEGLEFVPMPLSRSGMHPLSELRSILFLARIYRSIRPDIVHHVTIKPILYGSIAARITGGIRVINALSGLGYMFTSDRNVYSSVVQVLYRWIMSAPDSATIFQNSDDLSDFAQHGIIKRPQAHLIRGSGVDCNVFVPSPEPAGPPVVLLASRLLRDKGVLEFAAAAERMRSAGPPARFVLVGSPDPGNPSTVTEDEIISWVNRGIVEWWGHAADMTDTFRRCHMVVLPSYREGLPRVLLEAAACGKPIVATDVPGCREIVRHGETGILVPRGDAAALHEAISGLVKDPELRMRLGQAGRRLVENELSLEHVVEQTMALYRELLARPTNRAPIAPGRTWG